MSLLANIITEPVQTANRIVLLGTPKSGKSSFSASLPNVLFLPIRGEEGVDGLSVHRLAPIQSVADLFNILNALLNEPHSYTNVVIDSFTALEVLIHEHVCRTHQVDSIEKVLKGFGKGYVEAANLVVTLTQYLDALRTHRGIGCVIIGHVRVRRFDDPNGDSYDRYEMAAHGAAAGVLDRWADATWFLSTKTIVKKEEVGPKQTHTRGVDPNAGARYLFTQPRPSHPGGGRGILGHLPYEIQIPQTNGWATVMAHLPTPTNA